VAIEADARQLASDLSLNLLNPGGNYLDTHRRLLGEVDPDGVCDALESATFEGSFGQSADSLTPEERERWRQDWCSASAAFLGPRARNSWMARGHEIHEYPTWAWNRVLPEELLVLNMPR
jgi:hypothetical protein